MKHSAPYPKFHKFLKIKKGKKAQAQKIRIRGNVYVCGWKEYP